jgi:hypothetical protein
MCRLYDESLVRNIMVSTGLSILEFIKKNPAADADEICDFIEMHADNIIETTINDINEYEDNEEEDDSPPTWSEGEKPQP